MDYIDDPYIEPFDTECECQYKELKKLYLACMKCNLFEGTFIEFIKLLNDLRNDNEL